MEEEKGCEGTGGVGLEKGKGCEGKVKWGWRVQSRRREGGVQLEDIGPIIENCTDNVSHFLLAWVGHFFKIQNNWGFY